AVRHIDGSVRRDLYVTVNAETINGVNRHRRSEGQTAVETQRAGSRLRSVLRAVINAVRISGARRQRRVQRSAPKRLVIDSGGYAATLARRPQISIVERRRSICVRRLAASACQLRSKRSASLPIGKQNWIERQSRIRRALCFPQRGRGRSPIVKADAQQRRARLVHRAPLRILSSR